MTVYFDPKENAFHLTQVEGSKEITKEKHLELLAGQTAGKEISSDKKGNPILIDPVEEEFDVVEWRKTASMSKQLFCLRLLKMGILEPEDAVAAAEGRWPPSLNEFLQGLDPVESAEARIVWAGSTEVSRQHPLLGMLASNMEISDTDLDKMFGLSI